MRIRIPFAFLIALAFSGAVMAQSTGVESQDMSPTSFRNHALPVLVRVDKQGHVTDVQPAIRLQPSLGKMLRKTLEQMIVSPAMHDGHAVVSQFVIQLSLEHTKRSDGKYEVHFAYVSMMPVPAMPLHWVHTDGGKLALAAPPSMMDNTASGSGAKGPIFIQRASIGRGSNSGGQNPSTQSANASVALVGGSGIH